MIKPFDDVREQLERQYVDVVFDASSGLSGEQLAAELGRHRDENPDEPRILTKAWLLHLLCSRGRITPEPGDPFVGKLEHHDLPRTLRTEWLKAAAREFEDDPPAVPGAWNGQLDCASHICPDWGQLCNLGAVGLRDQAAAGNSVFHQAVAMVFDGLIALIKRYNALQPHPVLAALAERPPRTLHEALQLAYIYHEVMELDGMEIRSMGRFDLLYNDLLLHDLETGDLTRDDAKELLKYFWIKFFAKTQGKRFGKPFLFGPDPNALTQLAFEAYREMRIVDPKFHVRVAERTPQPFLEQMVHCILDGCTSMVIVNDDRQVEMLAQNGKTVEDANEYVLIGCYEPAIQGKELNCSGASTLNLAKSIEQVLDAGDFPTFQALKDAYLGVLDRNFTAIADKVRRWERLWPVTSPTPFLSGTMSCCMEADRDISEAGATYNTSGCCCIGLADAADSLAIIEQLVYEEKRCTLAELKEALAANWEGFDELRLSARHGVPKWGNNDDRVDHFAVEIGNFLGERINHEPNARDGVFQAALYGILPTVQGFGRRTGALPNGRRAGEPLAINTGATTGMDANGVTSLINSVTKVDLRHFPNGTVLDIMLHPSAVNGEAGVGTVISLIRSHFEKGGMALQFNIFDADTLRAAQQAPEKYANLQVRVCGWNVRFLHLSPEEQDMFIAKAEAAQ
ncbi:MAG: hypothetical protein HN742_20680 [Lentisphaerae bacterium]|nr:hypothetical protein [Lentisphaerota bacterium]MBT4822572.1 hypothetical protein [Lentisphaerota bacterium]MBT5607768.1 hypothetical protein [Lentisphaerota bacterium]MBT7053942.1 hypothetical protein [Lentisphaerota bacterium]MBT7844308.1 hypothetical protein [Lentisphaerota bacterium]